MGENLDRFILLSLTARHSVYRLL